MIGAIQRKIGGGSGGQDPEQAIHEAISALSHPDVPQDLKEHAAPVLLAVKHFVIPGHQIPDKVTQAHGVTHAGNAVHPAPKPS